MGVDFGPIDSLVQKIMDTLRFLDKFVTRTGVILWMARIFITAALLIGIFLFLQ